MKQFDVFRLRSSPDALVALLQSDLSTELGTKVVAPLLFSPDAPPISRLHVRAVLEGKSYLVQVDRLASIPAKTLGDFVGTIQHHEDQLKRSIDLLFFGI